MISNMETVGYIGVFQIVIRNLETGTIKKFDVRNQITDLYLNELIDSLSGVPTDLEVKYLAVGTGSDPVDPADIQLGNEIKRVQESVVSARTDIGKREITFTLTKNEAVGNIKEIGIFAGSTASSFANTGKMISRILWDYTKTSSEEIVIKRIDWLVRG